MTTGNTTLLGLALPVQGELDGTWGDVVNQQITELLDTAVAGTTTLNTDADVTLTTTVLAANQARQAVLLWTANGTTTRNITAPAQSKAYIVINASAGTQSIVVRGAGPTTGVTIIKGERALVAWNGSDFVKIGSTSGAGTFTDLTVTGNTILGDAAGDTITVNGATTFVNVSPTITPGTANGVAYLNGSKVLTTGSALTFDGTQLAVKAATTESTNVNIGGGRSGNGFAFLDLIGDAAQAASFSARFIRGNGGANATTSLIHKGTGAFEFTAQEAASFTYNINGSEQARLTSTGLGIGTSSPQRKLHVNATPGATYGDVARFESNGSAGPVTLSFGDSGTSSALPTIGGNGNSLVFGTGAATQMTLNLSGNLGLGVTPSAWNSDYRTMQFGATGLLYGRSGGEVAFGTNWYRDSGGTFRYLTTAAATYQAQASGIHYWFTAPSGTAGNAISFTQAMTLTAGGDLVVGGTTQYGSARLTLTASGAYMSLNSTTVGYSLVRGFDNGTERWAIGQIGFGGADGMAFYTGTANTERARITSGGDFLVGCTSSPLSAAGRGNITINGSSTAIMSLTIGGANKGYIFHDDSSMEVWNSDDSYMRFGTNNAERARITSGGVLLVGTTSAPSIAGVTTDHTFVAGTGGRWVTGFKNTTTGTPWGLAVEYSGAAPNDTSSNFLYCYDSAPALRMNVRSNGGIANYSANDVNLSDRREKTNLAPAKSYLDTICAIPVQTFNYIDQSENDPGLTLGVVAQDVQAVAPELVMESNWGTEDNPKMRLSIYQTDLQYALMKALQELKAEFDAYKATHP